MTWTSSVRSAQQQQLQQLQTLQRQVEVLTVQCTQAAAVLQQQQLLPVTLQLACHRQEVSWSVDAAAAEAGKR
jgi:hypothetical protein